ncbi:MAG TPA: hypothetical protein VIW64_09140 [Pyrinomonadaceae bacterium]|jgi:hypothetical protein
MTTRNTQVFVAPEGADVAIAPSPWFADGWVRIPYEHWALILEFAQTVDEIAAEKVERLSNVGVDRVRNQPAAELRSAESFLRRLAILLPSAAPLAAAPTEKVPEEYPNEEHARMCEAVAAVLAAAAKAGEPIRSWVD